MTDLEKRKAQATIDGLEANLDQLEQRFTLVSSDLEATRDELRRTREALVARAETAEARAGDLLRERNLLVAVAARLAIESDRAAWIGFREGEGIEAEWRNVAYLDLPTGQVSFHLHESERPLFAALPQIDDGFDGHDRGVKAARMLAFATGGDDAAT